MFEHPSVFECRLGEHKTLSFSTWTCFGTTFGFKLLAFIFLILMDKHLSNPQIAQRPMY